MLLLVEHGPLEALGDRTAEGDEQIPLVGRESGLVAVEEPECPDRTGLRDQRHVRGGGDPEVADVRPEDRVRGGEVVGTLDEAGVSVRITSLIGYGSSTRV